MLMLTKIGLELLAELPAIVTDIEADIAKIKAAPDGEAKLKAALAALSQFSTAIASALA